MSLFPDGFSEGIGSASFSVTGAPIKKDAEIIREIADNSIFSCDLIKVRFRMVLLGEKL